MHHRLKKIHRPFPFPLPAIVLLIFTLTAAALLHLRLGSSPLAIPEQMVQNGEISLESYCKNGYYEIPGEAKCSRAPNCGGFGYDELNTAAKMPNPQSCMGDGASGRAGKGCAGYVPACCYEVARTGDFTKCIGYWERLWCTKSQCDQARTRGASDAQCGGDCQCAHAFDSYCGNKQAIPIEQRLGAASVPSSTPATNGPAPDATKQVPDYHDKITATINQQFGVTIPASALSADLVSELSSLFPDNTLLRLVNPSPAIVQDANFQALSGKFSWYLSFPSYSAASAFVSSYAASNTKPITIGITESVDSTKTSTLKAVAPALQIQVDGSEFSFWPRDQVIALLNRIQPPLLHAVSFTLASNDGTDDASIWQDVKTMFDTMYDASKAIAAPKIQYPSNSQLALIDLSARGGSNAEAIMRKTAMMTGAITVAVQTESNKAPIRTIIAGNFAQMSAEEKTLMGYVARFIQDAPALFYPWAQGPNGEPFDVGGGIKPIWGVAGTKNGKVSAIFTNISHQTIAITFPGSYDVSNADIFSTTRGVGKWGQGNSITLSAQETIAFLSSAPPTGGGGPSSTPNPNEPSATPAAAAPSATTVPTITATPKPTKVPKPTYTPAPVIHRVQVTIPVMAIKLGKPTETQPFLNWLTVIFQFILPGKSPTRTPTPTRIPSETPTPASGVPSPTPIGFVPSPTPIGFVPSATPVPVPSPTASPTATPVPLPCPGTSSRAQPYRLLDEILQMYPSGDPPPYQNGDLNLNLRQYQLTSDTLDIVDVSGTADPLKPPQLATLFHPARKPAFVSVYQVNGWDWPSRSRLGPVTNPSVTLLGMKTAYVGEPLYPPFSDHDIGDNVPPGTPIPHPYMVYVVYAEQNRVVLKYDRRDTPALGYMLHIENICTDPMLLAQYNSNNLNTPSKRTALIALHDDDSFGTARTDQVIVATRTDGTFSDPRTRKNWWRGY